MFTSLLTLIVIPLIVTCKNVYLPTFTKIQKISLVSIILIFFTNLFITHSPAFIDFMLNAFCFIIIISTLFTGGVLEKNFFTKIIWINLFSSIFITALGYIQILYGKLPLSLIQQGFSSTFGNTNMVAQYIGASIVLNFSIYLSHSTKNYLLKVAFYTAIFCQTYYLIILNCRSILLAFFISGLISSLYHKKYWKMLLLLLASAFINYSVSYISKNSLIPKNKSIHQIQKYKPQKDTNYFVRSVIENKKLKHGSIHTRLHLWDASVRMISEKPIWGWGVDSFGFSSMPYTKEKHLVNEKVYFNNPHNEYLRITVEHGIPFLVSILIFLVVTILRFHQSARCSSVEKASIMGFIALLAIESFFQFPFYVAPTFLLFSFILAFIFFSSHEKKSYGISNLKKPFLISICIFTIFLASSKTLSWYLLANPTSYNDTKTACHLWPSHWIACLIKTKSDIEAKNFVEAESTLNEITSFYQNNFPVIRELGRVYFLTGRIRKSCEQAKKYNDLFSRKNKLSKFISDECNNLNH